MSGSSLPRYIVSDSFDYSKVICRDVGPQYAESLALEYSGVSTIGELGDTCLFIDRRISEQETEAVRRLIDQGRTPVLLKVIDPYWRTPESDPRYYGMVEEVCDRDNVAVVSMYEPREWLEKVLRKKKRARFLVLPYPYVVASERPLTREEFALRRDRALMSGAASKRRYPARAEVIRKTSRDPLYAERFEVLEHPGYPDIGEPLRHRLIGEDFIAYMAGYKFFFLCPSRADLEFLKYTECAYAGCVPVGTPASSLPPQARELFLDTREFVRSSRIHDPAAVPEFFERAAAYRAAIKAARDASDLRERLMSFVRQSF